MDPYVTIETRMQRLRTNTMKNAGMEPCWQDERFDIDVKYIGDDMHMAVWDEDMTSSDLVGETTIKLTALAANGGIDEWYSIQYKGKKSGDVHIKSSWKPTGGSLAEKPAQTAKPTLTYANGQAAQNQMAAQQQ